MGGDDEVYNDEQVYESHNKPDANDPDNEKFVAPADFDGPTVDRHCTDLLFLILLILCWVCMTGIGIHVIVAGDYRLLLYPMDYDGNICGTTFKNVSMDDYPLLYYVNSFTGGVCVKECPKLNNMTRDNLTDIRSFITYGGYWQTSDPDYTYLDETNDTLPELSSDFVKVSPFYAAKNDSLRCTRDNCFPKITNIPSSWSSEGVSKGNGYAYYVGDTYEWLLRCYLTEAAENRILELVSDDGNPITGGLDPINEANGFWNDLYSDLYTARKYILGFGFGFSFGLSFLYIFLMRMPVLLTAVIWASIACTCAVFFIGGYYAWDTAAGWADEDPQMQSDTTIHVTRAFSLALFATGGILTLLACCLRKQIQTAVGCVKQAGRAINQMVLLLGVPCIQAAGFVAFLGVFTIYSVYLASLGTISTNEVPLDTNSDVVITFRTITFDDFVSGVFDAARLYTFASQGALTVLFVRFNGLVRWKTAPGTYCFVFIGRATSSRLWVIW
jgi:Plasma-membrane choline transporter